MFSLRNKIFFLITHSCSIVIGVYEAGGEFYNTALDKSVIIVRTCVVGTHLNYLIEIS